VDFADLIDLAAARVGGQVLAANDEFFGPKERLVLDSAPIFRENEYTDRGKWMDGWETRRRREPGHDWCLVRLGLPGVVYGAVVDTTHFKGNYPEACSIEACAMDGHPSAPDLEAAGWRPILSKRPLRGDAPNRFAIGDRGRSTHLRLNIYPDGGVARLRVHGRVVPAWHRVARPGVEIDLAAVEHGGLVIASSDMFFGPPHNLILPGLPQSMADGWETRRRRGSGHDWVIVELGAAGTIRRVEVDTTHFKGNAPGSCSLEATSASGQGVGTLLAAGHAWVTVLPETRLLPHTRHVFIEEVRDAGPATHARFNIFPDGGVGRLRLYGLRASE
jgi:allantoicase